MTLAIKNAEFSGDTLTVSLSGTANEEAEIVKYFEGKMLDGQKKAILPAYPFKAGQIPLFTSTEFKVTLDNVSKHFKLKRSSKYSDTLPSMALDAFFQEVGHATAGAFWGQGYYTGPHMEFPCLKLQGRIVPASGGLVPVLELTPNIRMNISLTENLLTKALEQLEDQMHYHVHQYSSMFPANLQQAQHHGFYPTYKLEQPSLDLPNGQTPSQSDMVARITVDNLIFPTVDKARASVFVGRLANDLSKNLGTVGSGLTP